MTHSIGGFRHVLLLQDTYELIPQSRCYPPCCNSLCSCGLKILVLCSGNFSASATSLHLGWHAQPGNGSAGLSNHTTTGPETSAHCLKIVLGLTKTYGRQADVLLTKHQQAKFLWPHKQADVLLTKHQQARSLWPHTHDKAAAGKTGH